MVEPTRAIAMAILTFLPRVCPRGNREEKSANNSFWLVAIIRLSRWALRQMTECEQIGGSVQVMIVCSMTVVDVEPGAYISFIYLISISIVYLIYSPSSNARNLML